MQHGQLPGGQADGEDAVERGRPADRAAAHALGRSPDRHRRLRRRREEGHRVQLVMGPFVADRRSAPRAAQDLQPLVEHVAARPRVGLLTEGPELRARADAEPDAQGDPAVAQVVEGDDLPSHVPGPAPGQRGHQGPDPHPAGAHRDGGQRDPGVEHGERAFGPGHVIPEEEPVPARGFGTGGQVGDRAGISEGPEVGYVQPDLHRGVSRCAPSHRSIRSRWSSR